jgi:hypothetical protein
MTEEMAVEVDGGGVVTEVVIESVMEGVMEAAMVAAMEVSDKKCDNNERRAQPLHPKRRSLHQT